ncbi:hypothetical protein ACFLQU_03825 [Verrucomicrobiota bacterium]
MACCVLAEEEAPEITGFEGGKIQWKSNTNAMYRIEWASKLSGSNTTWSTNWASPEEVGGTGATTAAKVPMFYRVVKMATHKSLPSPSAWSAYDAKSTSGLNTEGFGGTIFDGRHVYFIPYYDADASGYHGRVLRFDTKSNFTNGASWTAFDAGSTDGLTTKGYYGGVCDGRYLYFSPICNASLRHGIVLRYDMEMEFTNSASWDAYDAGSTDGLNTKGFIGAIYDGRYVYFGPHAYGAPGALPAGQYHCNVLRYDTRGHSFTNTSSWAAYDASGTGGMDMRGFNSGVYDGRYIYYVPRSVGGVYHGRVLRLDTRGVFTNTSSWAAYDAGNTDSLVTKGYRGGVFDGRYVYFVPNHNGTVTHGCVLRYDTQSGFTNSTSWAAWDAGNVDGLVTVGYEGGSFDGRYIYFSPIYQSGPTTYHGRVMRYDTQTPFKNVNSWQAYDATTTDGMNCTGYIAIAFDGRFLYFSPWRSEFSSYHGRILRFDSRWPHKLPPEISGGSCY